MIQRQRLARYSKGAGPSIKYYTSGSALRHRRNRHDAYHEAGHVVAAQHVGIPVVKATIDPFARIYLPPGLRTQDSARGDLTNLVYTMGGGLAGKRGAPLDFAVDPGLRMDTAAITRLLRQSHRGRRKHLLQLGGLLTRGALDKHWQKVHRIARCLMRNGVYRP